MSNEIRKNINIKILKYAQKHGEFIPFDLFNDENFNKKERDLWGEIIFEKKSIVRDAGRKQEDKNGGPGCVFEISVYGIDKLREYRHERWGGIGTIIIIILAIITIILTIIFK